MATNKRIVIIGAGPTGLGAAHRLRELGHEEFVVYERHGYVGGISASFRDEKGFTWDLGGHVIFSHYPYFDSMLDQALNGRYLEHQREAWIRMRNRYVPYPFQNNIRFLDPDDVLECVLGLIEAQKAERPSQNFGEWILATFGKGIADLFMEPYNYKVWAHHPEQMEKNWIAERVSVVDIKRVLSNILHQRDDLSWGPNNLFRFPLNGGTGGLFTAMAANLSDRIRLGTEVIGIDPVHRKVRLSDGTEDSYDYLINTMPLDLFIERAGMNELAEDSKALHHNGVLVVGIGLKGENPSSKCWVYFPEGNAPFYRVTYFSNYSPNHVPDGGAFHSFLTETSYSDFKEVNRGRIIEETIEGLIQSGQMGPGQRKDIVSTWLHDVDYGYPVPALGRQQALSRIQPVLMSHGIFSRGRFGAWEYEVGNMDHSIMQGVEAVDAILTGAGEKTFIRF